ncbi:HAD family hydrolase [Thermodesulfobium sp. 4217-1]|uniref:HAD family hydrolase n=1 Tax=Thermodesulfobium sp. 4217-1 TaxID=3120013 RepID=UPI003221E536
MKYTIMWDFDGTIADTTDLIIESYQKTFKHFFGFELPTEKILGVFSLPMRESFLALGFEEGIIDKLLDYYRQYHESVFAYKIKAYPGARETIEELAKDDIVQAIVTSRRRRTTYEGIKYIGISEFIQEVICSEDVVNTKPDPEPIEKALEKTNSDRKNSFMIGDSQYDQMAANRANVKFLGALWGPRPENLYQDKNSFLIKNFKEIKDFVFCYNNKIL